MRAHGLARGRQPPVAVGAVAGAEVDGPVAHLGWDGIGIGMGLGWDWDPDWFTPQKADKTENRVFTKNLTKHQFLHIKTNFFTKT